MCKESCKYLISLSNRHYTKFYCSVMRKEFVFQIKYLYYLTRKLADVQAFCYAFSSYQPCKIITVFCYDFKLF